ncbi:MAG: Enoyl-CoA hydratase [Afipia sp.]|nr:MAG: Enoyl-CoA hydratase [Afipia sp.]
MPPQFGHAPPNTVSAQVLQNVHSNVQITASLLSGGRSLSQHSQFGLSFII